VGVVVHPGSFYGIGEAGRVVVSLLGPVGEFADGMERVAGFCGGKKRNGGEG